VPGQFPMAVAAASLPASWLRTRSMWTITYVRSGSVVLYCPFCIPGEAGCAYLSTLLLLRMIVL
jgi:hypothetical protein